jgi:acetyl esterase
MMADASHTSADTLEGKIRARGPVLDMSLVQAIYRPLLEKQPRDGVVVTRDVVYGPDVRHRLDVYQPHADGAVSRPLMIFLPGGGFIRGDKAERENIGQFFAREGFVVVVANYRLAPVHVWPAGAEDATAVYRWSRDNATAYGADIERVFLTGESAGAAHIAAATLIRRFHPPEGLRVAGVVLISGVYNPVLEQLARDQFGIATPDPRNEAYYGSDSERYPAMSTIALMDASPWAPLLITFAELDLLQMQVQAGELFARLVTERGFRPQLQVIRGHNHLTQGYAVNTGDESLSAPVLEFLRACCSSAKITRLDQAVDREKKR